MTSGPITSWQVDGGRVEIVPNFIFLGFQITSDYDCSHNIKRHLLLGRKAMTNLHIEIRDITLLTNVQIVKAIVFPCMDMRVGPWRLSAEELMLLNSGAGEDSWESPGQQGDETSQSYRKSTLNIHWKDSCWNWSSNTLVTWCEEPTHWKRSRCWQKWRTREGGNRGWHNWMALPTQRKWVCANSGR